MALPRGQFENQTYSWWDTQTGETLIGRTKAAAAVADAFPRIQCDNKKMLAEFRIAAAEKAGRLQPKSWMTSGTFSTGGERLQIVTSDLNEAKKNLEAALEKEKKQNGAKPVDLLPLPLVEDVVAAKKDLEEKKWTVRGMVKHCSKTGYREDLPRIELADAIAQCKSWEQAEVAVGRVSTSAHRNHRYKWPYLSAYFGSVELQYVLNHDRQKAFVMGTSALEGYPRVTRPWRRAQQLGVCDSISVLAHWAADTSLRPGGLVYASPEQAVVWYPADVEAKKRGEKSGERHYRNAITGTPREYRAWLDTVWETSDAARTVIETFLGLRPAEITNPGNPDKKILPSRYDFATGKFHVSATCKTGERIVDAPYNAQLMLEVLRQENRYIIQPLHNQTILHGQFGYASKMCDKKPGFRLRYPERYHKQCDPQGKPVLVPWGKWTTKLARHTCGSIYYAAVDYDCGKTAGYLGNLDATFMKHYKGKVHAEIYRDKSVYLACKAFYQTLPKQLRARGLREQDIELPKWFVLREDSDLAQKREQIREMASRVAQAA